MAATEKDAVCPAVTDWLAGCVVIEGTVVTDPVVVEASPEHPTEKIPSSITAITKSDRFIPSLLKKFPGASRSSKERGRVAGEYVLQSAHPCWDTGWVTNETIRRRTWADNCSQGQ